MRTALPMQRTRHPVVIRLEVDGRIAERTFHPTGIQSDGASVGEWRVPLAPGRHRVTVKIDTGEAAEIPAQTWTAEVDARPARLIVLAFEATGGFQFEP